MRRHLCCSPWLKLRKTSSLAVPRNCWKWLKSPLINTTKEHPILVVYLWGVMDSFNMGATAPTPPSKCLLGLFLLFFWSVDMRKGILTGTAKLDTTGSWTGKVIQDRQRDARLCMLYKIDRNLVAIKKDKRLIPPREEPGTLMQEPTRHWAAGQTKERIHSSQEQFVTGMCSLQTLLKQSPWTHSKPSY